MMETAAVPAGYRLRRHAHESLHLCAVVEGGFLEATPHGPTRMEAGWLRISPAARHDIDFGSSPSRCLVVDIPAGQVRGRPLDGPLFLHDAWLSGLVRRLDAVLAGADPARQLIVEDLAVEILAQVERRRGVPLVEVPPSWLLTVREILHDLESPPPASQLADQAGVHRVHLARAFRRHFGLTMRGYLGRVRLARACRLLSDDEVSLAAAAARAGYADQSHMTREMRRCLGVTPGMLRSRNARAGYLDSRRKELARIA